MASRPNAKKRRQLRPVADALEELAEMAKQLLELAPHLMPEQGFTAADLLCLGAVKRSMSLTLALKALITQRNYMTAAAVLRMHLDTLLRVFALTQVTDHEGAATLVLSGTPIRKQKARNGDKLQDVVLVQRLSQFHPWVATVYEKCSAYIHFSAEHATGLFTNMNEDGTFSMMVSATDDVSDDQLLEIVHAARHICKLLHEILVSRIQNRNAARARRQSQQEVRPAIEAGLADAEAGRVQRSEDVLARVRQRHGRGAG